MCVDPQCNTRKHSPVHLFTATSCLFIYFFDKLKKIWFLHLSTTAHNINRLLYWHETSHLLQMDFPFLAVNRVMVFKSNYLWTSSSSHSIHFQLFLVCTLLSLLSAAVVLGHPSGFGSEPNPLTSSELESLLEVSRPKRSGSSDFISGIKKVGSFISSTT